MEKFDVLVIGGGPAAITIAKNLGKKMKIGIIRPENHSMIYCAMPYAIEGLLDFDKTLKKDSIVTEANATLIRDKAVKVDFKNKIVGTEKSGDFTYDKVVLATGAVPLLPPIKGTDLKGVMTFKTEDDLKNILNKVEKGLKKAVVIGAGAIGIELAQALNEKNIDTHLVDMTDRILPNMVDYEIVEAAQEELIKSGVKLHLKSKVIEIKGEENIQSVVLENGQIIHFDGMDNCSKHEKENEALVVFAVGMKPVVDIFKETGLEIASDGIVINSKMETNIKDVYAVGDCCQFESGITGKVLSGKLATNAVPMARVLSNNLTGMSREYSGFFNGSATKVGKYFIGGTGLSEEIASKLYDIEVGYSEFTTTFPIMPMAKKVKLKLIADKKSHKILGGQFISGEPVTDKVDKLTMAIQYGITLEELLDFSYAAQPYQSFFPAHNLIVKASEEILKKLNVM